MTLSVLMTDTTRGLPVLNDTNGTFYVTMNGLSMQVANRTVTSNGYLNFTFNPNCSYSSTTQRWKADLESDNCYYSASSSPPNFTVITQGNLKIGVDMPAQGAQFQTTLPVDIRFNISTDCSGEGLINYTSTAVDLLSPTLNYTSCTPVNNESFPYGGWYNCTWDTTGMSTGMWGLRINASNSNFTANSTLFPDWINLTNTAPSYNNMAVTPASSGWGNTYNYSVNVTDVDGDAVNCTLYISTNGGSSWTAKGSMTVYGQGTCYKTVSDFSCSDIGTDNLYKFTLVDSYIQVETSNVSGPNLTVDTAVITVLQGSEAMINRTVQSFTMKVYINDTIKSQAVSAITAYFNLTKDGSNFTYLKSNTTSSGNATYVMTPDCTFNATKQKWNVFINNTCYSNSTTSDHNFTVLGYYTNTVISPTGNETLRGNNVTVIINVTDQYCGILPSQDLPSSLVINVTSDMNNTIITTISNIVLPTVNYSLYRTIIICTYST